MCRCSMEGHWWHLLYLLVFHAGISSNRLRASNCEVSAVVVREWLQYRRLAGLGKAPL